MPPVSKVHLTFLDESGEKSSVDYYVPALTALNIAARLDDANPQTAGSTSILLSGLSLCTCIAESLSGADNKFAQTPPGNTWAQREIGLMVTYTDTVTGKLYRLTIPGPDWANIGLSGSDAVDPADAEWTAFVAKFEAEAVSPDGNPVTISAGHLVGRNR